MENYDRKFLDSRYKSREDLDGVSFDLSCIFLGLAAIAFSVGVIKPSLSGSFGRDPPQQNNPLNAVKLYESGYFYVPVTKSCP